MQPVIYAEHLVNIHTLRVQVWLASKSNDTTVVQLSPGGTDLTVQHDGEDSCITLPTRLLFLKQNLDLPAAPTATLNFRFRLPPKQGSGNDQQDPPANIIPWTARSLGAQTEVCCASCQAFILPRGQVTEWHDLPTEGWAEMMEFWHCHKPSEPDTGANVHKGYSANSKLNIRSHSGLVSATSLLFEPKDLSGIQTDGSTISCRSCEVAIGGVDGDNNAARLSKYALAISTSQAQQALTLPQEKWAACTLLTAMESQGTSRLTVLSPDRALSIWIFAPDMSISASFASRHPVRVIKVMWKDVSLPEASAEGNAMNRQAVATGTLEISSHDQDMLRRSLASTHEQLPQDMKRFQDWQVSLLPKFTLGDVD